MSCPGLVAKSGISWTLRAGQDGQAGGVVATKTRGRLLPVRRGGEIPEKLLGHGTKRLPRRGEGGNLAAWQVRREYLGFYWYCVYLGDSSGGSHH